MEPAVERQRGEGKQFRIGRSHKFYIEDIDRPAAVLSGCSHCGHHFVIAREQRFALGRRADSADRRHKGAGAAR